ncbi:MULTISPECIES: DUF6085 family protein [unclassified Microbacterium]|uniref:DUF6085 family protein n=1 Tax=unclassified Microbacterium TaxID=2609290 RepID=UPI003664C1AC
MSKSLHVLEALVAEGIKKQMTPNRRYLAASERKAIAEDAATVAIAALIDLTGGPDHIVVSDGETWTLQHPLTERLTGDLFDCEIAQHLAAGEPLEKGRYTVRTGDFGPAFYPIGGAQ